MKTIEINQTKIAYRQEGTGEPVLFVHGLGASIWTWEQQAETLLREGYQVILPDLRGHGQSHISEKGYQITNFADDIIQLLAKLNIERVHLVGLSMGGIIAFEVAAQRPNLVKSLLISNTGPEYQMNLWQAVAFFVEREFCLSHFGIDTLSKVLARKLFPDPHQEELRTKFINHWTKNDTEAYRKSFLGLIQWEMGKKYKAIQCPTCLVGTPEDYTTIQDKMRFVYKLPNASLHIIENSRHITPLDQPELFNCVMLDFLRSNSIS